MAAPAPQLSPRDRAILRDLQRVRLLTGRQLERLHFADLATANARGSGRRRTMQRLVQLKLVATLDRRVGGVRAGSSGLIYRLDARAYRQAVLWQEKPLDDLPVRLRRPWPLGWQFVCHGLAVSELYVRLRERERASGQRLHLFLGEPAAWYGGVKPDAFTVYDDGAWEVHRWLEVDRATESLPTLQRKLQRYLGLAAAGDAGPRGILPTVLVTVPDERRQRQVTDLIARLPDPASDLFAVTLFADAFLGPRPPP